MFRMYGNIVEILKYSTTITETIPGENGEPIEQTQTIYTPTEEEAIAFGGTVIQLEPESDYWMDGIVVPDVPNTMAEAIKIRDMGEAAYKTKLKREESQNPEQLRADLDYLLLMEGV